MTKCTLCGHALPLRPVRAQARDQPRTHACVIERCGQPYEGFDGDAVLFLGDDWNGVPLEIGAIELDDGDLLVIHAMKLRRKYRGRYKEALLWHR